MINNSIWPCFRTENCDVDCVHGINSISIIFYVNYDVNKWISGSKINNGVRKRCNRRWLYEEIYGSSSKWFQDTELRDEEEISSDKRGFYCFHVILDFKTQLVLHTSNTIYFRMHLTYICWWKYHRKCSNKFQCRTRLLPIEII